MHAQNSQHVGAYTKEESELEKGIIGADDCPQANKNEGMHIPLQKLLRTHSAQRSG